MLYKLMLCKLYKNHLQVNAMQNKDQQKRILKTILTDFSRKEKAISRYARIYIKTAWQGWHKTSKKLYFHCGPSTKSVEM